MWVISLKEHTGSVNSVSFNPDGKTLVSASSDGTVKLWNIKNGRETKTFKGNTSNIIISARFSPDGKTLASASNDGTVKLWDVKTTREIKTFKWQIIPVISVSFSSDGKTLASASNDGTVILWNLDLDDLLVQGCGLIQGYLENNPHLSREDRHLCDNIKNHS